MAATRGTPLQGSRSAHDVTTPALHASDIENDAFTVHLDPTATAGEAMVMGGAGKYVATEVLTPSHLGGFLQYVVYGLSGETPVLIRDSDDHWVTVVEGGV
jgi:hypothetical protein